MKSLLTSVLLLVFASLCALPEPAAATATPAEATTISVFSFKTRRPARRTKKVRPAKMRRSSAARAYSRRTRHSGW